MDAPDLTVLRAADAWLASGMPVWLATVIETYGSAPRPVGAMAALNGHGHVVGSVSGGCVEDELIDWLRRDAAACTSGRLMVYGADAEERARLRLPCQGRLSVWLEPACPTLLATCLSRLNAGQLVCRRLDIPGGRWTCSAPGATMSSHLSEGVFQHVMGPVHRLVLIGASDVSRYLAPMAMSLGFQVEVVDPRAEYRSTWPHQQCQLWAEMPDDVLAMRPPDTRTAVIALSHDPKLDDLALMEALKSDAMYVGAMGSLRTTAARKSRLLMFDVTPDALHRLRGPVGLDIGARTPPEIAVAIAADLVKTMRSNAAVTFAATSQSDTNSVFILAASGR
ncbi:MAG TPA: XdhC family protein [Candidatus Aquabacterium excrementipullorum]|nr:XdhC family protein [Candidatus Aquabacterium excrementipullorum]